MKKIFFLIFVIIIHVPSFAQIFNYAAFTIPDSLKKDADVVVREEKIKFTIKDINSAKFEVHQVITILNEDGSQYLNFNEFSYKFRTLDDAEIKVYDAMGIKKNTYSKKEMISLNYGDGLVPEGKVTYFNVAPLSFPFTVEFNYTVKYKGLFSYPGYLFQTPYQSVQQGVFEVEAPTNLLFRYKILNCIYKPVITKLNGNELYRWEVKNLPAYKIEKYIGAADNFVPQVMLAPNKFQLEDYDGDMTSWKNFGTWMNDLYIKTTSLTNEKKQFYQSMVKNVSTDKEKASILYNYMQSNMRYVSIQLGIGGLRPFPASFVDEKKYGDCKALSNYLKSALDAVGVKSNVVIIQGSSKPKNVFEDFPANYFNHVILCVPQPKDSIWLECTSTTLPFAQLGSFTENRRAMLVTDNGGVLINTPKSNYKTNTANISTTISVSDDGTAKLISNQILYGEDRNNLLMEFHDLKEDAKRTYLIKNTDWKQPDYFNVKNSLGKENPYNLILEMEYSKIFSFKAGSKYFFEPRLYPILKEEIPETENRVRDYYFEYPFQTIDTTVYIFPANFSLDVLPTNKLINFSFASFNCNYTWDAAIHKLTTIATLQIKERIIKAADYANLLSFKKQVLKDMNDKIVMKKE